jgi:predicted esterase
LSGRPHDLPPLAWGAAPERAAGGAVAVHGRGASPEDILFLVAELGHPELACLAPRASGATWYPFSFLAPLEDNEPWLGAALEAVGRCVASLEEAGLPAERIALLGFSQGACLALEYAARNPRRYGCLLGLSGGLIGPPGTRWERRGSLAGTPAFLGCSDRDPHIPAERVRATASELEAMGARVEARLYPGLGHEVNVDEIEAGRRLLDGLAAR